MTRLLAALCLWAHHLNWPSTYDEKKAAALNFLERHVSMIMTAARKGDALIVARSDADIPPQ